MDQMEKVGFCLINDVEGYDEQELLRAARAFHDLPLEVKMTMALKHFRSANENIYHGYFPFIEGDPSHKEIYDMSRPLTDITKWERDGCPLYEEQPWMKGDEKGEYTWI